jgi:6-phosphogluconolactonase
MTTLTTRVFSSRSTLDAALAERLARALSAPGASAVMLSGGHTPLPAYRALAQQPLRHDDRLHVLFSDERYVPADSPASNYLQCKPLLDVLGLPAEALLRVHTELPLDEATARYERELTTLLSSGVRIGLGLLGLGADGHTASLFSEQDLERARGRYALAVQRPDGMAAVSVTPELLATVSWPGARCKAAQT